MQISTLTDLPKATVHRILAAMMDERLVERPPGTRHYRLGPDIFAFGIAVRESFDLKQLAHPSLERLASETGAAIYLGVRSGYDMLCLDRVDGGAEQPSLLLEVNDRWPMGIGSFSLALLAFLGEAEIADIIEFNRRRVHDEDTLTFKHIQRSIQKTRRNGYAKRTTRSYRGIAGVAVPVFDERRYPIASLCAVASASRLSGAYLTGLAQKLMHEAGLVTKMVESSRLQQQQQEKWRVAVRASQGKRIPQ
jgi:DNA-binding IclR family transcriptional regulator